MNKNKPNTINAKAANRSSSILRIVIYAFALAISALLIINILSTLFSGSSKGFLIDFANAQSSNGTVSGTVTISENNNYRVWVRMKAGTGGSTVGLVISQGGHNFTVGGNGVSNSNWTWVDWSGSSSNKMNANLSASDVTVTLSGIDNGVQVDRVIFSDQSCTPTNFGDNCITTTPPPDNADFSWVGISEGQTVSAPLPVETIPINAAVVQFDYYIDGQFSKTDKFAPHCLAPTNTATCQSYDFNSLSPGAHTIRAVMTYDTNKTLEKTLNFSVPASNPVCEDPAANNTGGPLPCTYDPPPNQPGDTDNDGDVDIADLSKLLSDWDPTGSSPGSPADFNNDGKVDVVDLSVLLSNYGN